MKINAILFLKLCFLTASMYSQSNSQVLIDSISSINEKVKSPNLDTDEKFQYLKRANTIAKELNNDSIYLKTNRNIVNYYFANEDYENYIKVNHKIKKLSIKLEDSLPLARAYYGLGSVYQIKKLNDSAYYYYTEAIKLFDKLKNKVELSYSLGNLSGIQLDGKDYFGADENAISALKALESVEETNDILDQKWILYNTLGSVAYSLKNYDKAIEYHDKALEAAERMENDYNNSIYTLNNIALVRRDKGNYEAAYEIFKEVSEKEGLFENDPSFYALILENLAYTKYLTGSYDTDKILKLFEESYRISDSIDDRLTKSGAVISMAKFYLGIGENSLAEKSAKEAYNLAKEIEANEIYLESMKLLSVLNEGERGKKYLNEYIKVSDSLLHVERSVRNKRARIELETDQLEAENEQISKENLYLVFLSIGLLLTAVLVFIVISQRAKNRKLKLIQVQQKANEDIYNLMLGQQDKVDEARTQEKKRISEELHDGVLGRLFGTRLSLDSINFKDGKEAMMTRANYIGQLKSIEEDIRKISHELNTDFVSGTGFMDIVSELIENQTQAYGLTYDFDYTDDISWDSVSNKTKINIYRIIQESMQNIYKHANAKAIKISISLEKNVICLDIIDDGEGFDTSKNKKGIGLKNMTSRVEDINGKITFTSQSGNGTIVNVKIPYSNQST